MSKNLHVIQGGYGVKIENKLPFHQGKRTAILDLGTYFP